MLNLNKYGWFVIETCLELIEKRKIKPDQLINTLAFLICYLAWRMRVDKPLLLQLISLRFDKIQEMDMDPDMPIVLPFEGEA